MKEFNPTTRILMGPGPSGVHPRVYESMAKPIIGHLDPQFLQLMDDVQVMLRQVFQTQNKLTIPVSGTGSAGMETLFVNLLEPGDTIVIGINGVFGNRMQDLAGRCGANVVPVVAPWGQAIDANKIDEALAAHPEAKAVAVVHAETSTGVLQPMDDIARICRDRDVLLMLDAVTSLAGTPVKIDEWGVDACYSGTQKCLSCPPGLAPITVSDRGLEVIQNRKTKVQSWYLDLSMVANYWTDGNRAYHHTAPINMNYALREALRLVLEEGLEARYQRHQAMSERLWAKLEPLGLKPFVDAEIRLPQLNAVALPSNIDEASIRKTLLNQYNIEVGAGLGDLAGKVWRIGLMGESCQMANVEYLSAALAELL